MASFPPSQNAHVPMTRFVPAIDPVLIYKVFLAASSFLITSGAVVIRRSEQENRPGPRPQAVISRRGEHANIIGPSSEASPPPQRSSSARQNGYYSWETPVDAAPQALVPDPSKHQGCPTVGIDLSTRIVGHGNNIKLPPLENSLLLASILSHASTKGAEATIRMGVSVYGSKNSISYETPSVREGHPVQGKKRKVEEKEEQIGHKRRG